LQHDARLAASSCRRFGHSHLLLKFAAAAVVAFTLPCLASAHAGTVERFDLKCTMTKGPPPHHITFSLDFRSGLAEMTLSGERTNLGKFIEMTAVLIVPYMPEKGINWNFDRVTGAVTLGDGKVVAAQGTCVKAPYTTGLKF
jgi:hypothetical protein